MSMFTRTLSLLIVLLVSLSSSRAWPTTAQSQPTSAQATTVLIGLRPGVPALPDGRPPLGPAHSLAISSVEALPVAPGGTPLYRLRLAPGTAVAAALTALRAAPALAFAELDQQAVALAVPTDPGYSQQWGLTRIGAEAAWDVTQGSSDTVIAVIDAGIDASHPDLADRLWTNPDLTATDVHGWNFIANSNDLSDSTGHGTQVAGIIAANANNGLGGVGLCPNCRLMILKVLRPDGTANYSDIAAAIGYAATKRADVINLSLGGTSDSAALRSAVTAAATTSVMIAGAGNGGTNTPFFPAAYNEHVLAVAATNNTDIKSADSNYGPWIDVAAPGEGIYTTYGGGGYGTSSGTSMGAPFVSGLAGLLLSAHPDWSPAAVRAQIIRTATSIAAANPSLVGQLGGGLLAAGAALTTAPAPLLRVAAVTVNGQVGGRPEPGSTATVLITLANDWFPLTGATATLSGPGVTQPSADFGTVPALGTQTNTAAFSVTVAANAGYNTALSYALHVTATDGFSTDLPLTITTAPGVTDVGATINTQHWTADRVYRVNGETGIPVGQTLTIDPGTVVRFATTGKLRIQGTLLADGTAAQPITFTSQDPTQGWAGVIFEDSSQDASFGPNWAYQSGSILRHVAFENGAVQITQAAPYIANNSFGLADQRIDIFVVPGLMSGAINGTTGGSTAIVSNSFQGLNVSITGPSSGTLLLAENQLHNANLIASSSGADLEVSGNRVEITDSGQVGIAYPAINVSGALTVTNNLVIGGGGLRVAQSTNMGMVPVSAVTISGNLVVGATSAGLTVEPFQSSMYGIITSTLTVSANTIVGSTTTTGTTALQLTVNGMSIYGGQPGPLVISDNNLVVAPGNYGIRLSDTYTATVDARNNYWGGVNPATDALAIYDGNDKYGLGIVSYDPPLATPAQTAPAFVQSVAVTPDTTLGIQTGTFTVHYSRPMDTTTTPALQIEDARRGTFENKGLPSGITGFTLKGFDSKGVLWGIGGNSKIYRYDGTTFSTLDLPAPSTPGMIETVQDLALGAGEIKWALTSNALLRYDGTNWSSFSPCPTQTMPMPTCSTWSTMSPRLAVVPDGTVWVLSVQMGTTQTDPVKLYHFDGSSWTTHVPDGVMASNMLTALGVTVSPDGAVWVALQDTTTATPLTMLLRFANGAWTRLTPQFPASMVSSPYQASLQNIVFAPDGTLWASFGAGLGHYAGGSWQFFKSPSTGMGLNNGLMIDALGVVWVTGSGSGWVNSFDGSVWHNYKPSSGSTTPWARELSIDRDGHKWFNTTDAGVNGLYIFRDGYGSAVPTGQWLDEYTYQAELPITALIARGPKRLTITGANASDGRPAADNNGTTFTVDYAGQVSDRTPPPLPYVFASGLDGDTGTVHITYAASDAESSVDQVRYAIGSAPGAIDIVGWTALTPSITGLAPATLAAVLNTSRSGLGLTTGSTYYVSLQARNSGGLWSAVASSAFVAGQTTNPRAYITALSPTTVTLNTNLTLTVTGYGFLSSSTVLWNGQPRPTTYVSATELKATISSTDTASAGTASISVRNPAPGGGDADPATLTISGQPTTGGSTKCYLPFVRR